MKVTPAERKKLTSPRGLAHLSLMTGCTAQTIRDALLGRRKPHPATRRALEQAIPLVLDHLAASS